MLTALPYSGKCRITTWDKDVNLGNDISSLLGFESNKTVSASSSADLTSKVNINLGLQYFTISFNSVDSSKLLDRYGNPSEVVAVLPIDTTQRLKGTFTHYKDQVFEAPFSGGTISSIRITVKDNLPVNLLELYLLCEVEIL